MWSRTKVIRNAEGEITSVTYMTEEEVAKALPRILGGANEERDTVRSGLLAGNAGWRTGGWRELDEVIDNAAFTMEAYMVQKDFPYETVIDFEWLYGKLEHLVFS